jgi:hypothetical protein
MKFKTEVERYKEYLEPHEAAFELMKEAISQYKNPTIEDLYYELNEIFNGRV